RTGKYEAPQERAFKRKGRCAFGAGANKEQGRGCCPNGHARHKKVEPWPFEQFLAGKCGEANSAERGQRQGDESEKIPLSRLEGLEIRLAQRPSVADAGPYGARDRDNCQCGPEPDGRSPPCPGETPQEEHLKKPDRTDQAGNRQRCGPAAHQHGQAAKHRREQRGEYRERADDDKSWNDGQKGQGCPLLAAGFSSILISGPSPGGSLSSGGGGGFLPDRPSATTCFNSSVVPLKVRRR